MSNSVAENNFLSVLHTSLQKGDTDIVRQYLYDPEKEDDVAACAFEALRPIHKAILTLSDDDDALCTEYIDWLMHLVTLGTPKEILLGLLEIIEEEGCLKNCVSLIPLLQNVLIKLPGKRVSSLEWTLSALDKYIKQLPVPKDHEYEGDERKFLDLDLDVIVTTAVLSPYIVLIKTFVTEVSLPACSKMKLEERVILQRNILTRFLLSLLGYPLAYMDLEQKDGNSKSKMQKIAEECVASLFLLKGSLLRVYETANDVADSLKDPNLELSLGVLAYLAISENVTNICPSVYEPWFLLENHLKFTITFLSKTETIVIFKGVCLLRALLLRFPNESLTVVHLDFSQLFILCEKLFNIMIHCPSKELRQLALTCFRLLLEKFNPCGLAQFIITLLQGHTQPMVQSLLLNIYKDKLNALLKQGSNDNPYLKNNLERVLKIATKLDSCKVETDLIDNSSRILSSLNLLRYVALTEKATSLGVCEWMKRLPEHFLDPLRMALNMSRAHYKKQLEESSDSKKSTSTLLGTVNVGNETLPNLPSDYEAQICASALRTFDLIESVLVRVEEILDEQ